jgi:predicted Fe-Mo cluster-binding NifX family protein
LLKRAKIRTFELSKNDYKRMKLDVKIAVPTRDGVVDDHFGHCAYYTIFAVEADGSLSSTTLPSPEGCGCKSNIASVLQTEGVRVMLAGNMGAGAKNVLERHGIKVIRGQRGEVEQLVRDYLAGQVHDSGEACDHHDCH